MLKPITDKSTTSNLQPKQSKYVDLEIKNGILYGTYKNVEIDLEVAKEVVTTRLQFQQGETYPTIVFGDNILNANKEARDYFVQKGEEGLSAAAMVVTGVITKMLVNFYLKVSKPNIPTKFFNTEEEALEWIIQFRK
ncbi:MAG: hypothetical protein GY827_04015 [Cytophagales bacterium]|nr:hypothetical protein [Cytophagales bacterium]